MNLPVGIRCSLLRHVNADELRTEAAFGGKRDSLLDFPGRVVEASEELQDFVELEAGLRRLHRLLQQSQALLGPPLVVEEDTIG